MTYLGKTALNQLNAEKIQELIDLLHNFLKPTTIQVIFQILKKSLSDAVKKELIEQSPCETVQLPKVMKHRIRSLSRKEQNKLEELAKKKPLNQGLPTILSLQTGLRIGEIAALKWEDIDFDAETIHVQHTYQRISRTAGNRTELIYMGSKTVSSKRVIPMTQQIKQYLLKKQKHSSDGFVFSINGKPCEPRLLTYYFHQLRREANLEDIHFHQLRHTFATRCIESNGDIASVSALLGHSSTQMTLDVYTDALLEQRVKTIQKMEKNRVS